MGYAGGNADARFASERLGLVHVYTGDGKGKTTAAFGLAIRTAGAGLPVHIVQFMKGGRAYGEARAIAAVPNVTLRVFGQANLVNPRAKSPEARREAWSAFKHARESVMSGLYRLVILDEINVALAWGLLPLEPVMALIEQRPMGVELVLTGRYAPTELMARADLVTEMCNVRHPHSRGTLPRRGIEY